MWNQPAVVAAIKIVATVVTTTEIEDTKAILVGTENATEAVATCEK